MIETTTNILTNVPHLLFGIDLLGTIAGIAVLKSHRLSRLVLPLSGGVMLGIAFFWILPEMAAASGLLFTLSSALTLLVILFLVDRYLFPVCPCCSYRSKHCVAGDQTSFIPLLIAILVHNVLDGWTAAASHQAAAHFGAAVLSGLLAHKVPEAMLFGMMLRISSPSFRTTWVAAVLTSSGILGGAWAQPFLARSSAHAVATGSLVLASASFLFAGIHLFVRQGSEAGWKRAVVTVLSGVAATFLLAALLSE